MEGNMIVIKCIAQLTVHKYLVKTAEDRPNSCPRKSGCIKLKEQAGPRYVEFSMLKDLYIQFPSAQSGPYVKSATRGTRSL